MVESLLDRLAPKINMFAPLRRRLKKLDVLGLSTLHAALFVHCFFYFL